MRVTEPAKRRLRRNAPMPRRSSYARPPGASPLHAKGEVSPVVATREMQDGIESTPACPQRLARWEEQQACAGTRSALSPLADALRAGPRRAPPASVSPGRRGANADSRPDLAVANAGLPNSGPSNVSVLLGRGDGSFGGPTNFPAGQAPSSVAIGDFNNDSRPDLAVANHDSNNVSVLLGRGDGSFGGRASSPPTRPPSRSRSASSTTTRTPTWRSPTISPTTSRSCWPRPAAPSASRATSPPATNPCRWQSATSTTTRAPTWRSPTLTPPTPRTSR